MKFADDAAREWSPRMRGCSPPDGKPAPPAREWSPRMRGCSRSGRCPKDGVPVVPAHAGMFPRRARSRHGRACGPRACGDVPPQARHPQGRHWWSPRMRGCSPSLIVPILTLPVVPAHAGMFPQDRRTRCGRSCGPRACGDVPQGRRSRRASG